MSVNIEARSRRRTRISHKRKIYFLFVYKAIYFGMQQHLRALLSNA